MRFIIMVEDRRTSKGINTRAKNVDTISDGIIWARRLTKRVSKYATCLDNGKAYSINIEEVLQ